MTDGSNMNTILYAARKDSARRFVMSAAEFYRLKRPMRRSGGTSFASRAFESRQQEATMAFSMPSYFLGVGTVVGALTLGFGGGVLLTKTAIKETPNGPSRIERAARAEPAPQPQVTETKPTNSVPLVQPAAIPGPASQVQAAQAPAQQEPAPQQESAQAAEPAPPAEPAQQVEAARQIEPAVRVQQQDRGTWMTAREQRRAERERRRAERRVEREKRLAERKVQTIREVRGRQRPVDEQDQPARPELAFEREEPRGNLFEGLFGRPTDAASGEGRE
jgi:hypothetical protein